MKVQISWDDVKSNIANKEMIDRLDSQVIKHAEEERVNLRKTMSNIPELEIIGWGRLDNEGESYIEDDWNTPPDTLLCQYHGKYLNLWVNAEGNDVGFDDQVELHF